MYSLALVAAVVFCLLLIGEYLSRYRKLPPEICRKFIHITVGSFVAFWPLFLTWNQIFLLSAVFVVVIGLSKYLKILRAIHSVQRPTWGEVFFALSVGLLALLTQDGWMYMAALLHMSLADGLAAVIGVRYGKKNRYSVLGHVKSFTGTLTFLSISLVILIGYSVGTDTPISPLVLIGTSLVAAILENVSTRGLDNITVPVWIAIVLSSLG